VTTRRQFLRRSGALVSPSAIQRAIAAASDASYVFRNGVIRTLDALDEPATCVAVHRSKHL
jgi:hypothetical protein